MKLPEVKVNFTPPQPIKMVIDENFDWCKWGEMVKATIIRTRKTAKRIKEDKKITRAKLEAIRNQEPEHGNIAIAKWEDNGQKMFQGLVIR